MNTSNRIQISGDFDRLFQTAADIARWPRLLPHYRWVKVLERRPDQVVAEMAARHKGVPLWWRTIQAANAAKRTIVFKHIGGITKGMDVQWTFEEVGESCLGPTWLVQIHHQFSPDWPWPGTWFANRVIGEIFVQQVAQKTLTCMKRTIETIGAGSRPPGLTDQNGPAVLQPASFDVGGRPAGRPYGPS